MGVAENIYETLNTPSLAAYWNSWSAYLCGGLSALAYDAPGPNGPTWKDAVIQATGAQDCFTLEAEGTFWARIACIRFPNVDYIAFEGTKDFAQAFSYLTQFAVDHLGGDASKWVFKPFAMQTAEAVTRLNTRFGTNRAKILCGHSLGGAMAAIFTAAMRAANLNVVGCYTFGCPKIGSLPFANSVGPDVYRVFAENDPVPSLPPEVAFFHPNLEFVSTYGICHVGEDVPLGNIDQAEAGDETVAELRNTFSLRSLSHVSQHYAGAYNERLYDELSNPARQAFGPLAQALIARGSQGLNINSVQAFLKPADGEQILAIQAAESSYGAAIADGSINMQIRLFTAPAEVPPGVRLQDLVQANFPGYAPKNWNDIPVLDPNGLASGNYRRRYADWALTADLPGPLRIVGAYATVTDNGVTRLAGIGLCPADTFIRDRGDSVDFGAGYEVASVA